jgi:divalent metal cation (Fe/Co/Zn/Cd) transporter
MNPQKIISIILFFFSFGALKETARIFSSSDSDIESNRTWLMVISVLLTCGMLFIAIKLWIKGSKTK